MMRRVISASAIMLLLMGSLSACDGAEEKEVESAEEEPIDEAPIGDDEDGEEAAQEVAYEVVEIEHLGLHGEMPADAEIGRVRGAFMGVEITGTGLSATVAPARGSALNTDIDGAREFVEEYQGALEIDVDELEDGWLMRYHSEPEEGTLFWIQSIRTIDEESYICTTSVADEQMRENGGRLCRSLH